MSPIDDQDEMPGFLYQWDRDQALTQDRCFLCGADLAGGRTDEHVFPQWLLRRCDLQNEKITLLNGTLMPYKQMKIPCCSTCNNEHLSRIERAVGDAFTKGPEAVAALDTTTLFLWMGKIYYGLMFRELSLLADRRDPQGGSIVSPEFLTAFRMHHLLLQAARGTVRWRKDQHPASVFVFQAQEPTDPRARFDYVDITNFPFLAIRVGTTAVVAVLQDWGALAQAVTVPALEAARQLVLHPQQFREVAALAAYMTTLFNRVPKHLLHAGENHVDVMTLPLQGMSAKFVFNPFDMDDYAQVLSYVTGQPLEELYDGHNVVTLLRDRDDQPWAVPWPADERQYPDIRLMQP
ncbi:hypothetical protein [Streptomyces sp. Tu10]|uniref:hypothetical protein n=1 Tax=Streptomyces sp. Tu10 TaxID=2838018 RepID=UPI0027E3279A|nr:hypothetical protein [Streptomyces sp. Tu10]